MNLCEIVGLNESTYDGKTYETESIYSNKILHDIESGKGITKTYTFTKYTLFIVFENRYYSLELSYCHIASIGGKLCSIGNIKILHSNSAEIQSKLTHNPIKPIVIPFTFEVKNYYEEDDMRVCLHEYPETCVFEFSKIGNSESNPCGYVYVNMELFCKK